MSHKVCTLIWDHFPEGGGDLLTALCLADHAEPNGTSIFPSVARIARMTMQSERTVQRHLEKMRDSGWLVLVEKGGKGPTSTNEYRIPIEAIPRDEDGRVTKLHPSPEWEPDDEKPAKRVTSDQKRVTPAAKKGDTAMSPEQGLPVLYNKEGKNSPQSQNQPPCGKCGGSTEHGKTLTLNKWVCDPCRQDYLNGKWETARASA